MTSSSTCVRVLRGMVSVRVRLRFDSTPVHYARQCWFLFNRDNCRVVEDVAVLVARHFGLQETDGIQLHMDGFLLPANESAEIIRDNDMIHVIAINKADLESSPPNNESARVKKHKLDSDKRKKRKLNTDSIQEKEQSLDNDGSQKKRRKLDTSGTAGVQEDVDSSPRKKQRNKKKTKRSVPSPTVPDKPTITISATSKGNMKDTSSKNKEGKLRSVTSKSASGALHIKFCSSSGDSEPENVSQTVQTTPVSGKRKKGNGRGSMNSSFSGSKKKFPAVVGGPGDVHTTRSTIYTRTDGNSRENLEQSVKDIPTSVPADAPADAPAGVSADVPAEIPTDVPTDVPAGAPVSAGISAGAPTDVPAGVPAGAPVSAGISAGAPTDVPAGVPAGAPVSAGISADVPTDVPAGAPAQETVMDYASLPDLDGAPRVGDMIAFKVLELSTGYTPEVSVYKKATVLTYDSASRSLRVKFSSATVQHERQKAYKETLGRFSLNNQPNSNYDCPEEVDILLESLIQPKLIPEDTLQ